MAAAGTPQRPVDTSAVGPELRSQSRTGNPSRGARSPMTLSLAAPRQCGRSTRTPSVSSTFETPTRPTPRTAIRRASPGPPRGTQNSRRIVVLGRAASARNSMAIRPRRRRHEPSLASRSTTTFWRAGSASTTSNRRSHAPHTGDAAASLEGSAAHRRIQRRSFLSRTPSSPTIRSFGPRAGGPAAGRDARPESVGKLQQGGQPSPESGIVRAVPCHPSPECQDQGRGPAHKHVPLG